jgi:hypothetical protein
MQKKAHTDALGDAKAALVNLLKALGSPPEQPGCHLFLYAKRGREPAEKWRRLKFAQGLATKFRDQVAATLVKQLSDREVSQFSFDEMVESHVGAIRRAELPDVEKWIGEVPTPDWPHVFDGDERYFSKVRFHVTRMAMSDGDKPVTIFRQRSATSLLHRGGFKAIFSVSQHQFRDVDGPIFDFALDADFLEWDGFVFIIKLRAFEALTDVRQLTVTKAKEALGVVAAVSNLEVEGLDGVVAMLEGKPLFAKKLAAAKIQGTADALNAKALCDRIDEKELPLTHKKVGKLYTIVVDPTEPDQVREFVNLVTDVYLRSPVTSREYRVHAKDPA